ncbi:AAA family ATPase [Bradyrhizobium diazoefficiens]|uniref:adenylate/guanylate cyclase domain-containing protein n=1 Tax=Bradyrhizobium sp. WYCCWR 12699 TaxID=3064203 RepID=UPI001BA543FB|nr:MULTISPECIES: adenylate/guanylate cyclase domain-containing protein [Bradyrhizobium]MBR0926440.1 AAA family ATPase [Bradyrhizobium diazoefficiens]MDT4743512.1 adenylate/guanylate cyclase domain-containing protein [Bradyrhizobium sp. WYCCWR 12699]
MDVGGWLRRLGLEQYEAAFRDNEIDDTVLPNLTAEDLKDLGVGLVGHRRKLLDAIAAFRAKTGAPAPLSDVPMATDNVTKDTAERRQVTVMFSDLVGSTSLSTRMDPEDLRDVISAYQTCVAETVRGFEGFVAKYMGDGVLIYFGYPQAHEDDAERAVRAGLEAIAAVGALKLSVPLQTRVGIATGLVVVGDLIGSGEAQERGIIGETPNLAARLQGLAEPNTVVIAETTRRLLGNLFELKDVGPQELKGIPGRIRAWAALRPSIVEGRFEALHAGGGLSELIGRQEELELLMRRWSKAKTGQGQVVLLSGEPGIGKSRLTAALIEQLASEPHTRLRYFCSSQHTDSALYPIITQMERAAGFAHDDTIQAKLDRIDTLLAQFLTPHQDIALLTEMLSLPNDGRYPNLELTAPQRRQETFEALTRQVEARSKPNPVLMIFEDVHWIDPTSLEALGHTIDRLRNLRVLLIITYRPEFEPPWIGRPYVTAAHLNRLGEDESKAIVNRISGSALLPANIRQDIIERTDGIPLFVEEITKAVLEAGEEGGERSAASMPSRSVAVPPTLHASLLARLDRLGSPAREVAQVGAAIGREFSYELLLPVAQRSSAGLNGALDQLVSAELIFRRGMPPHAEYTFKHALVQDAAYSTLLRAPRQRLHARIAEALEQLFPQRASIEPELLAHHFTNAGQAERAISYWLKAGRRAAERSADKEAVRHLRRGLEILMVLPHSAQKDQQELDFQLALGTPLAAQHGYGNPVVGAARDRAIALCEKLGDMQHLLPCLYGQYAYCIASGKIRKALEYSERCQSLAAETGDRVARLIAHRAMGASLLEMGEFEGAKTQLEQILAIDRTDADQALSVLYLADPHASGLAYLALSLWALGYPDQAVAARQKAIKHALDTEHANTSGIVAIYAGAQLSVLLGKMEDVRNYVDNLNAQLGPRVPLWATSCGQILKGWAIGCAEQLEGGIALMKHGIHAAETQVRFHSPQYHSLLAVLQARAGDMQDSVSTIRKAKELMDETGEFLWQAEVLRIEGELRLLFGAPTNEAEAGFVQALEVARKQRAKSLELRAAMSLARLWRDRGKGDEARELLAPLYGWFAEGFDTLDLKQARALLTELAQ